MYKYIPINLFIGGRKRLFYSKNPLLSLHLYIVFVYLIYIYEK